MGNLSDAGWVSSGAKLTGTCVTLGGKGENYHNRFDES